MRFGSGIGAKGVTAGAYFVSVLIAFCASPPPAPLTGPEIAQRTIARARASGDSGKLQNFTYKKLSVSEELDGRGHVKERKEKVLFFRSGSGSLLEMKVNGRPLTGDDFRKQEELASQDRQKMTAGKSAKRDDNWEKYVTPDLLNKYQFKLLDRTVYNGRPTYVLSFSPVSRNLPVKQIADRLINQIAGKLWVDEQEFEVARAEITLQSEVNLWGGVLGVLKKMYFVVDRTRVGENAWFNRSTFGDFEGRKLLDSTHMKLRSESSNFERILPMSSLK
ncbi:MAG TPA: hypothetical protein VMZ27_15670 [Candidatus Saccharimonadales bacterium]|nr:hypothetical protein [Candidatus Saccharimonadales bacterium]